MSTKSGKSKTCDGKLSLFDACGMAIGGVPILFVGLTAVAAALVQFFGNLGQITGFSSLVFLVVFSVVNLAAVVHHSFSGWSRVFPVLGCAGCLAAVVLLVVDLFQSSPATVWVIAAIAVSLGILRIGYVCWHPHFLRQAHERETELWAIFPRLLPFSTTE